MVGAMFDTILCITVTKVFIKWEVICVHLHAPAPHVHNVDFRAGGLAFLSVFNIVFGERGLTTASCFFGCLAT